MGQLGESVSLCGLGTQLAPLWTVSFLFDAGQLLCQWGGRHVVGAFVIILNLKQRRVISFFLSKR